MIENFTDIGVPEDVARAMADMGWEEPTPIQTATIRLGIEGRDMFGQAQTGTGKTGAFGSIILGRIQPGQDLPRSIILLPTRELALQAYREMTKLAKYTGHVCVPVYGGQGGKADIEKQISTISKGADIIAGTPGRVRDLVTRGALNLTHIEVFVMKEPKEITVSEDEVVLDLTKQYYIPVGRRNKSWALCRLLDSGSDDKYIIFCQTIKMVDMLEERMEKLGYKVEAIHGDLPQTKRERVINDLRTDKIDALIATDVAARGLDIEDITYVINYDMPEMVDTYIHRIGRTGRAGKEGTAVSFVTSSEEHLITEFQRRTDMLIEKMAVPELPEGMKDRVKKVIDYDQIADPFGMVYFKVNLGKADGYGKVSLADFIIRNARIHDTSIGKIQLGDDESLVQVHRDFANRMTMDLTKAKHKGKHVRVEVVQE